MKTSKRLGGISPSLTMAVTSKAKALKKSGVDVISFAAGEPDFDTPEHIVEAARRALAEGQTRYTPAKGMPDLIEAVRRKFLRENGLDYAPEQIVISCGAKHSLFNAVAAICDEGDEVIIPSPYWVTYPEQVKLAGGQPVIVPGREEDGFRLPLEDLEKAISPRTAAIIVSSPCNPTGGVFPREDLERMAALALEHDFAIISDDIYEHLVYDGFQPFAIASIAEEVRERTIVVNGVSKAYAMTGWRIGYLAAPAPVAKAISSFQSHSTSNPMTVAQFAAVAALNGDQACVEEMRRAFESRRNLMVKRLRDIPGVECINPVGTFYTFPNISALGVSSLDLAEDLLEKARIAVVPGAAFGWDSHIRMSFADSEENLEEGLARFDEYVRGRN